MDVTGARGAGPGLHRQSVGACVRIRIAGDERLLQKVRTFAGTRLIRGSFAPPTALQALRTPTRIRKRFVRVRAAEVQRIEKFPEDAEFELRIVSSGILGQGGRAVLQALIDDHADPDFMASRVARVKASRAE